MATLRGALAALVTGVAAALVLLALAILPFLTPAWVAFGQQRAGVAALTGFTPDELRLVTDAILRDLVLGPPAFEVALPGTTTPVLDERERAHMRDVRGVFAGFAAAALAGAAVLAAAFARSRTGSARARLWRRLARAGGAVAAVTVVGGGIGMLVFDQAFTLFHEIFFPGGNWAFDPRTERLVQLFPDQFWTETTLAVGILLVALSLGLRRAARRRAARLEDVGGARGAPAAPGAVAA